MVTQAQVKSFIDKIAPIAQKAYKELGKVLPSIAIGMACVECGYGTAGSCKHHSYFGYKVGSGKTGTKYWGGKFFTSKTEEEYQVGVHTTITAAFRAYDSMEQCVFNFYELLNTSLYSKVKADVDYKTQMQQIKVCGYMTSSTEVNSVISIVEKYNLTQYDSVVTGKQPTSKRATIKMGSIGSDVIYLQQRLVARGYGVSNIDGVFGIKTLEAVKAFQAENDLAVDGIVGANTWSKLE